MSCTTVKIAVEFEQTMAMMQTEAVSPPLAPLQRPAHHWSSSMTNRRLQNRWIVRGRLDSAAIASGVDANGMKNSTMMDNIIIIM
eukprot:scaffold336517_cov109-Cyclotella_meneghiniana.AAC.1